MGKIFIMTNHSGGGGGADTSVVTATASDVLVGKIIVDAEGEPVIGAMPNQGTVTPNALNAGSSYTIPQGYHSGSGKVTANSLANQTGGTATATQILKNQTAWVNGSQITGTMIDNGAVSPAALGAGESYTIPVGYHNGNGKVTANSLSSQTSADATAAQILSGKTAWVNGSKITGTLAIQSLLSFNAAPSSSSQITFTWKNPAKGAFSGVIIIGKTGSTPTSISDGTRWYKGSGNNSTASGTSSTIVGGFSAGTTYYFRAFSYAIKDNAEWIGSSLTGSATTSKPKGSQTFTSSGTFTVPSYVFSIDIFVLGGGAAGGGSSDIDGEYPAAAGGGYTNTKKAYAVTPGQTFSVTIGAGGSAASPGYGTGGTGGTTSFGSVISAGGGYGGEGGSQDQQRKGGSGGSGGGGSTHATGYAGGSNGGNGNGNTGYHAGGSGQGRTTRAFAESSNTLYAGGGGGGPGRWSGTRAAGGAGGGGRGGNLNVGPGAGSANTGGGGGGGGSSGNWCYGGNGGSGICIVRWGY